MIPILIDINAVGDAGRIWALLGKYGWLKVWPIEMVRFAEVGLSDDASDREVWQVMQEHRLVLLTLNRNASGPDSLQRVMDESNTLTSMPIATISRPDLLGSSEFLLRCGIELIDIATDIKRHLGRGRIFIPKTL